MGKDIRVRFAPSPTGAIHMGNLRAAIFNWLFVKKSSGSFVLRMEDTDAVRSTKEAEEKILAELSWVGIKFDEGVHAGGEFAPYRQSERGSIYNEYLDKLIAQKKAYRCYCTKEELEEERRRQVLSSKMPSYSGRCATLTAEEEKDLAGRGRKPVIRLLVKPKIIAFDDIIKSRVSYDSNSLGGDFIIRRSNCEFVYNFTVVIDDALMKISHVIRGEDHLTNTIKQLLLYEALGFEPPKFAHCPLILGDDGKKLSKRFSNEAFSMFRDDGILPDALINYTALLGWSAKDGTEIFTTDALIDKFELKNVASSPSTFNYDKLKWINGEHIKIMGAKPFASALFDFLKEHDNTLGLDSVDPTKFNEFAQIIKDSLIILKDALDYTAMFFSPDIELSKEGADVLSADSAKEVVRSFIENLNKESELDKKSYQNIIENVKADLKVKGKDLFMPLRAAITGDTKGPHLDDLCTFLRKEAVIKRVSGVIS